MPPDRLFLIIALVILLLLTALFSASETAYSCVNRIRLKSQEAAGDLRAKKINKQLNNFDSLLTSLLIGNNVINILITSLVTVLFVDLMGSDLAVTLSTVVVTVTILVFGEITPKIMAKERPEAFLRFCSPIIYFFSLLFLPLTFLFSQLKRLLVKIFKIKKEAAITEDELLTYVETAKTEGGIEEHESQLICSAIEFEDLDVGDIMTPRVNVIAAEIDEPIEKITELFFEHGYSRLPVYKDTIDSVVGFIHEKDYYYRKEKGTLNSLGDILQKAVCVSDNMKISAALKLMQRVKSQMAIVVDEYGGTAGIVTMEDIIEQLVGEIYDEYDDVEEFLEPDGKGGYTVSGLANLTDVFEELGIGDNDEFDSTSVGGFVTEQMHKIPLEGESFTYNNLVFTVTKATDKRVTEINITKKEKNEEE